MKIKKLLFLSVFLIIGILLFIPNTVNAAEIYNHGSQETLIYIG